MTKFSIPRIKVSIIRENRTKNKICTVEKAAGYIKVLMEVLCEDPTIESMVVIGVNNINEPIGVKLVAMGGSSQLSISAREICIAALEMRACGIILSHNHPSGDPTPSIQDLDMTCKVIKACKTIGIQFLDHIIICDDGQYLSMAEQDLIRI